MWILAYLSITNIELILINKSAIDQLTICLSMIVF